MKSALASRKTRRNEGVVHNFMDLINNLLLCLLNFSFCPKSFCTLEASRHPLELGVVVVLDLFDDNVCSFLRIIATFLDIVLSND